MTCPGEDGCALLDSGGGRRLERLGGVTVARPAPGAVWRRGLPAGAWEAARLSFTREGGWRGDAPGDWRARLGGAVLGLQPLPGGQVGAFPEHAAAAERILSRIDPREGARRRALHCFAHTGLATLLLAATGGFTVAHVDASAASVRRARENAVLSGLSDRPVRWLVDDALAFLRREARRGGRYDLILADPPSFGRSGKMGAGGWKLERDLPAFLALSRELLAADGLLALTCHTEHWDGDRLSACVRAHAGLNILEASPLILTPETREGAPLPCGHLLLAR